MDTSRGKAKAMEDKKATVGKPVGAKEQEFVSEIKAGERVPIVEVGEPKELPEEVEGWLERVERGDVTQPQPVVHRGRTIVSPAAPQQVSVTLPLTEDEVKKGLHHKLFESIRWMAEWCVRIAKKYHGKVAYTLRKNEPFDKLRNEEPSDDTQDT